MIDIDVENDRRYGVIEQGSLAHRALRQLRTDLIRARLGGEDGVKAHVNVAHVCRVLKIKFDSSSADLSHLVHIGLLDPVYSSVPHEAPVFNYMDTPEERRAKFAYIPGCTSGLLGFTLAPLALDAITQLRDGADYVRFPFP